MDKEKEKAAISEKLVEARKLVGRMHPDGQEDRKRNDFQRDYARILYSAAFRRLQGKMQMLGIDNTSFYRNRLTHSLEVSQVARSICNRLELNQYENGEMPKDSLPVFWNSDELYMIEAISLAHDIGNPPFGHAGEAVLNNIAEDFGGFEGNAQTFRIVTKLEKKYPNIDGLNLTKRTLLGLVKHFHKNSFRTNKFLYDNDYCTVRKILNEAQIKLKDGEKTIDCAVMDLADEIAYGAHDLEDALQQKYINADDLMYLFDKEQQNPEILKSFTEEERKSAYDILYNLIKKAKEKANSEIRGDSDDMFDTIFRKELCSEIVDTLINDVGVIEKENNLGFRTLGALCAGLKKLLFNAIKNDSEMILLYERQGKTIIEGLYEVYSDKKFNDKNCLLPTSYRLYETEYERKRMIIDYISGMMDTFAISQYEKYYGSESLDGIYNKNKRH